MPKRSLERLLQSQGFGTKRECRVLIRRGVVSVAGTTVKNRLSEFETDGLQVRVEECDWLCRSQVYLAMHKPLGYECSRKPTVHQSVMTLLPPHLVTRGVQPVGRLDHDTTGLLLLTDDGPFNHAVSSPNRHVSKSYRATTTTPSTPDLVARLLAGVQLHGESEPLAASNCELVGNSEIQLEIAQGKYHQVKRMLAAAGNSCVALHRTKIGNLILDELGLAAGEWMVLDDEHVNRILSRLQAPLAPLAPLSI
ncbi:MAG: 16S rRNA pseudouridine516 synthase [Hyphomicrobiaceae bacterium]|jgi:16S rRNA pseudouridine516 synthase